MKKVERAPVLMEFTFWVKGRLVYTEKDKYTKK